MPPLCHYWAFTFLTFCTLTVGCAFFVVFISFHAFCRPFAYEYWRFFVARLEPNSGCVSDEKIDQGIHHNVDLQVLKFLVRPSFPFHYSQSFYNCLLKYSKGTYLNLEGKNRKKRGYTLFLLNPKSR